MDIRGVKYSIRNILVIRRNNIGDMICAIPALKTIRNEFPQARLFVLADSTNAGILENASFIDEIIVCKKGRGIYRNKYLNYWKLLRQNKKEFDLAIALKNSFSSVAAFISLISGAKIRAGCVPEQWHPLKFCYNLPVTNCKEWKFFHQVDALLEFLKTIGIENPVKDVTFQIMPDSIIRAKTFLKTHNIQTDNNIVVFNISNNRPENRWPIERFKETADILSKEYKIVYLITSAAPDKGEALKLSEMIGNDVFYCETPEIMDFAALVSVSDLLICGEGGAMHIGASVQTPTISLWGGNRTLCAQRWAPYGEKQFVIKKDKHVNSILADDVLEVIKKNGLLKEY